MLPPTSTSDRDSPALAPPVRGGTYVMRGRESERILETYHLILAPTHACNLRCRHCYLPDHSGATLPEQIALALVDQWSEITLSERGPFRGIFHVKGGEPFVVPYLSKIFERLADLQSLRLMLTTNGTHTNPSTLDTLHRCNERLHGHATVIVSLDGATPETHEILRGKGQFEITMFFLKELRRMGIHTFLNCVINTDNLHEVQEYLALARSLHVAQVNFLPLVPRGIGANLRRRQAPHIQVHNAVQHAYQTGDEATQALLAGSLSQILDHSVDPDHTPAHECVAGYRGLFYITPSGDAHTCPNLTNRDHILGNVHKEQLLDIMNRLTTFHRTLRSPGQSDRFLCTGERIHYTHTRDHEQLTDLVMLQDSLSKHLKQKPKGPQDPIAYCVSRNF